MFNVLNLQQWINENRHLLQPPVNNKEIYPGGEFIIMVVGGPNQRKDYHYNETPEFFYQLEGNIQLKLMVDGQPQTVDIKQGEIYLLPSKTPHSPQRQAGTIGLVIEQKRSPEHTDGFLWYCEACHHKLHEVYLKLENIETQMPLLFKAFKEQTELHTCKACGHQNSF
jgi:3-hydroxyanthranilate 3,4-dioxygenase